MTQNENQTTFSENAHQQIKQIKLKRSLSIAHLVLYGLGVTIGAGIYVLIGATAGRAGLYAPTSFILAALVMAFTASSFAELSGRYPVSAGEAAYIREGLRSNLLALVVGLLVVSAGVVSAATISIGSTGYIRQFFDLPVSVLILIVVLLMGFVSAWGILESITVASIFTLIEVGGLLAIIFAGLGGDSSVALQLPSVFPSFTDLNIWIGIASAGLLAFFAFIGFEDLVNVAEEAKNPKKAMPWAIFLTLVISTLVYFLVVSIAVLTVPLESLTKSEAPLGLVFRETTGFSPIVITAIAIIATLNGVIVQMIMASRVLYGLANQGNLPEWLAYVNPVTRTPLLATGIVVGIILILALVFPLTGLAEMTSRITLSVFTLVNLALLRIKLRGEPAPDGVFIVPSWVPVIGILFCLVFLSFDLLG